MVGVSVFIYFLEDFTGKFIVGTGNLDKVKVDLKSFQPVESTKNIKILNVKSLRKPNR